MQSLLGHGLDGQSIIRTGWASKTRAEYFWKQSTAANQLP
jgi:hypothetical protein